MSNTPIPFRVHTVNDVSVAVMMNFPLAAMAKAMMDKEEAFTGPKEEREG